ncbi:hypothetical protein N2603_20350 [Bradyrhizobium huanghuaihaiense]|uniref:hypothetical protein n=1 Tax=Bradyrhizobium huanghuaihaiense TaxID=990078 RepID=UPI0021A9A6BC|nr:hypothetical protein [Bradyrhizobium sp. CB3035]UWU80727.1 hypothetical protein N2603_20350 [Bradyrhizobium sp. CB3035]
MGIVLSVIWALSAFFYVRSRDIEQAGKFSSFVYSTCSEAKSAAKNYDFRECSERASKSYLDYDPGPGNAAIAALLPIPFMWLGMWLVVAVTRWVVRGFKKA